MVGYEPSLLMPSST